MNVFKSVFYLLILGALFGVAYFLPSVIQKSPGFKPLAETMTKSLNQPATAVVPPAPEIEATPPLSVVPASAIPAPQPKVPAAIAEASAPPAAIPSHEPVLSPFIDAMASADFAKAEAVLDLIKSSLPEEKYTDLKSKVVKARAKETERLKTASAPPPAMPAENSQTNQALIASQTALAETLKQLQATQVETAKMVADLKSRPAPTATSQVTAPTPVSKPEVATPPTIVTGSTPLPGAVTVHFGYDSSLIEEGESAKLAGALKTLKADSKTKVEVRGYADKSGDSSYNLGLSAARAQAVKDTLRASGIEEERIKIVPFGSFNATPKAKAEDLRKVEIYFLR